MSPPLAAADSAPASHARRPLVPPRTVRVASFLRRLTYTAESPSDWPSYRTDRPLVPPRLYLAHGRRSHGECAFLSNPAELGPFAGPQDHARGPLGAHVALYYLQDFALRLCSIPLSSSHSNPTPGLPGSISRIISRSSKNKSSCVEGIPSIIFHQLLALVSSSSQLNGRVPHGLTSRLVGSNIKPKHIIFASLQAWMIDYQVIQVSESP
ncbi:hypothetical protein B0H11DRAFT_707276 [Mycena galericulata]|nr:hypothetical protein B0H11DRAFT_707276 [Mycena galericulata]